MLADGKSMLTHLPEGPGLMLYPGRLQRLVFTFRVGTGWDITLNPTGQSAVSSAEEKSMIFPAAVFSQ